MTRRQVKAIHNLLHDQVMGQSPDDEVLIGYFYVSGYLDSFGNYRVELRSATEEQRRAYQMGLSDGHGDQGLTCESDV